ncbi:hypothetical protein [Nocardia sp. NPDC059239]|uniref:hypothetical protein n=1 Tax=unclassified Nocardia TaxID=2637762 RepID=UPI0036B48EE0
MPEIRSAVDKINALVLVRSVVSELGSLELGGLFDESFPHLRRKVELQLAEDQAMGKAFREIGLADQTNDARLGAHIRAAVESAGLTIPPSRRP